MKHTPYNVQRVDNTLFWDYNFKIQGIIYEVSVNLKTGELYINRDEDQGE